MKDEVYSRLRSFLDRMPGGFPATGSRVELEILERCFTPAEAELVMRLEQVPEPVGAIAERLDLGPEEAADRLEALARRGNILRIRFDGEPFYMPIQFLIGIYEFHLDSLDPELARLLDEYLPHLLSFMGTVQSKQMRVIPVGAALDTSVPVMSYDVARELVSGQEVMAVAECICRKEKMLLGRGCDHPLETCLTFGPAAEYYLENGMGRRITLEECLGLLDEAEREAMVLEPTNSKVITHMCICCGDACNMLRALKSYERPADHALSSFRASIDPEECTLCGTCAGRCQVNAVVEGADRMEVDPARCIGCGLCVPTCLSGAARLVSKSDAREPPADFIEMQMKIAAERGLT
ncbi:MAG: 4Fe-4S binding protein [Actinobacteria bacterium]|nr:4Fe-4S binding protein [Actinomycetota bacterium]MBU1943977.1 4Fe-4S binding protein [Actinomycetota bacterium]MBU2686935.1 4Fe-4S binding protein [Actinomycetota bacterium]